MNNYIYGKIIPHFDTDRNKRQFKRWIAWIVPQETIEHIVIIDDTKEAVETRTQEFIELLKARSEAGR